MKHFINVHQDDNLILTQTGFHREKNYSRTFMYEVYDRTGVQ